MYVYGMIRWLLLLLLLPISSTIAKAQAYDTISTLFAQSPVLHNHFHGFSLYDLDEGRFVGGVHEQMHFTPASNTKIFTLLQSLKHIGDSIPGIAYIVRGDSLLFWGTGDPTFLHRKLDSKKVFNFLSKTPYKLFYVPAEAMEPAYRNGWAAEDFQEDFQPDIASFPIYGNVVEFRNRRGQVRATPDFFDARIGVKPGAGGFTITRQPHENYFDMSSFRVKAGFVDRKPFIYDTKLFVQLLQDTLHREVEVLQGYSMPTQVQYVYSVSTESLLREMMWYSDNFIAEQLQYVASFLLFNQFNASRVRQQMADDYYSRFSDRISLHDASGLSFYNKVTPRSMVELLLLLRQTFPDEARLRSLFPAGRSSGTLRNLYSLSKGKPFIWAKTGTVSGVYCQSGYLVTESGKRYAFSFLNNNYAGELPLLKQEMVRIMTFIHHNF